MVYFKSRQPEHTPRTFPLQINHSFSDQHPKIAKALRITAIVLVSLSLIALVGCIAALSGGAVIPLAAIGGIAAVTGLLSSAIAIYSAKKALTQRKQKQLANSLPLKAGDEHVKYITTNKFQGNNWETLEALVQQFSKIDLTIQSSEKELLKEIFGTEYKAISQTIEGISDRFAKIRSLLYMREQFYRGEERYNRYLNTPLLRKNRLLTQITSNMIRLLPRAGGVFSIKANTLSRSNHTLYTILKVSLSLGVIAAVASLVIFLPPSLPVIAALGLASLSLGIAAFLMARGIRYLLEQSAANRKQLAKDIQKTIGPDVLSSMTHYQHQLLSQLHETLLDEAITARWNQPLFIEYSDLELKISDLTKQYNILNSAFEQALREDERLRAQLETRAYRFVSPTTDKNSEATDSRLTGSENDSDSGFQEILNKGLEAAKRRRETANNKSDSDDKDIFSIWKPSKQLALEDLWRAEEACTEEQKAVLVEDYMSYKTLECQAALQKVRLKLQTAQKSLDVLEKQAEEAYYESNLNMMDLARANQETYRLLNILSELQQLAQHLLDQ
jgi:hypothetical protein